MGRGKVLCQFKHGADKTEQRVCRLPLRIGHSANRIIGAKKKIEGIDDVDFIQAKLYHYRLKSLHFGGAKAPGFKDFSEGSIHLIQPSEKSLNRVSFRASPNANLSTDRDISS